LGGFFLKTLALPAQRWGGLALFFFQLNYSIAVYQFKVMFLNRCLACFCTVCSQGTPFDFRTSKAIGRDIAALSNGYDHNLVVRRAEKKDDEMSFVCK